MGLKDLFKKKKIEEQAIKEPESFKKFYDDKVAPMLNMFAKIDLANMIGIEPCTLDSLIGNKKNTIDDEQMLLFSNLDLKINSIVSDQEFNDKLKSKMDFIREHGKYLIIGNKFVGTYKDELEDYYLEVNVSDTEVKFYTATNIQTLTGKFVKTKGNRSYIKYVDKKTIEDNMKNSDSYGTTSVKTIYTFNERGIQEFKYEEKVVTNYSIIKQTGEIILNKPDSTENYTEKSYEWRAPEDSIMRRVVRTYIYPDNTEAFIPLKNSDSYTVGRNIYPHSSRIPAEGYFHTVPKETFNKKSLIRYETEPVEADYGDVYPKRLKK